MAPSARPPARPVHGNKYRSMHMLKGNIQETNETIETLHKCELYESYILGVVVRALPLVNKLFSQLLQHYIYVIARKTIGASAMKPFDYMQLTFDNFTGHPAVPVVWFKQ